MSPTDAIATVGVGLLLLAFVLQQRGLLADGSAAYLVLNLVGAATAGVAAWMGGFMPFVVLEAVWVAVAAAGLVRLLRRRREALP